MLCQLLYPRQRAQVIVMPVRYEYQVDVLGPKSDQFEVVLEGLFRRTGVIRAASAPREGVCRIRLISAVNWGIG